MKQQFSRIQQFFWENRGIFGLLLILLLLGFLENYKALLLLGLEKFGDWFNSFSPNIGFISDVIAVQGAVLAIALPLSFEIVTRISERYQSGIITREFNKERVIASLRVLVIVDILVGVAVKFFFSGDLVTGCWKLLA